MAGFTTEPRTPSIRTLLREVYEGRLLIPRFQRRGLQWDATRRLELFDSIYRGFPIGSLLVWRTDTHQLRTRKRVGLIEAPVGALAQGGSREYLLDGHQRISVLYTALGPAFFDTLPELDAEEDEIDFRWPICFDLRPKEDAQRFIQAPKGTRPAHVIPLDCLFDAYRLDEVKDGLRAEKGSREEVNKVVELADLFRNTQLPVVPVVTERIADATTSFKRVNSGGVRMDEVDMVHALSWSTGFDLEEAMAGCASRLAEVGWGDFPRSDLLAIVKRRLDLSVYKTSAEALAKLVQHHPALLDEATEALLAVAAVLKRVGVHGPLSLPYTAQAVLLASESNPANIDSERALFWIARTGFTERFAGATDTSFREEALALREHLAGRPQWSGEEVDPVARFDFRTARCRLLAHILAVQAEKAELPALRGPDALTPLVPATRREPLTSTVANRFVLDRGAGLHEMRNDLRTGEHTSWERHLLDDVFAEAWRTRRYQDALAHRLILIDALEREWAAAVDVTVRVRPRPDGRVGE